MWILHVVSFICCTLRRNAFKMLQINLLSFLSCSFGNMYIFICVCFGGNILVEIGEIMMQLKFQRSNDYLHTWYILSIFKGFYLNVAYTRRYESNWYVLAFIEVMFPWCDSLTWRHTFKLWAFTITVIGTLIPLLPLQILPAFKKVLKGSVVSFQNIPPSLRSPVLCWAIIFQ